MMKASKDIEKKKEISVAGEFFKWLKDEPTEPIFFAENK